MKKKAYLVPKTEVVEVPLQLLIVTSDTNLIITTSDDDDLAEDPNG